jgi:membrane protease YdiL (CAAX protease family)
VPRLVQLVPYVFLSAAIVSVWLTRGLNRLSAVAAFLTLAVGSGFAAGVLSPAALLPIAAFGALCWAFSLRLTQAMRVPLAIAVVLASLALMAHVVPGFSNVLIVKDAIVSQEAPPFTLYLNFDKALIGLFLLFFATPLITSRAEWLHMLRAALPRILIVIGVVLAAAFALGYVRFEPKWPAFFPFWAWANLLFTCTAEEAVFRGVIQRTLAGDARSVAGGNARGDARDASTRRSIVALVVAAVLFGAVHFAGGPRAIVMAAIAGAGYGWVYWRSGNRIEASILAHFLLNVTHILLFTYPMLATPAAAPIAPLR